MVAPWPNGIHRRQHEHREPPHPAYPHNSTFDRMQWQFLANCSLVPDLGNILLPVALLLPHERGRTVSLIEPDSAYALRVEASLLPVQDEYGHYIMVPENLFSIEAMEFLGFDLEGATTAFESYCS